MSVKNVYTYIDYLIKYGVDSGLSDEDDTTFITNRLLEVLALTDYEYVESNFSKCNIPLADILKVLTDYGAEVGLFENTAANRDLFDTKLMGCLTPMPSFVRNKFRSLYSESPKSATDFYYAFSKATNYIRTDRIAKDEKWTADTKFGTLDITINLSKPEKDPRDIAAAGKAKSSGYPKCLLCLENEGYAGHLSHPARQNHRVIPVMLNSEQYYLQYSPYVYYNEHCIVFNKNHIPMKICRDTFAKLLDFVRQFPHYTLGSNADLPIVGGSILSHDHFQGGGYEFPMVRAPFENDIVFKNFEDVHSGIIRWPLSTIRLQCKDPSRIVGLADKILTAWRGYSDPAFNICAFTDSTMHNTITPIARMRNIDGENYFELDLVLRNNITTDEHPLGLFHPHEQYHHIKKENIGLIEVMGLAVLPARLESEMAHLEEIILSGISDSLTDDEIINNLSHAKDTLSHKDWVASWLPKYRSSITDPGNLHNIVQQEIGIVFSNVLENAGVYKETENGIIAFMEFIKYVNS